MDWRVAPRVGTERLRYVATSIALNTIEQAIERTTGMRVSELRKQSVTEIRTLAEKSHGKPMRFTSSFPFIGRGNVLRDCLVSHEEVEASLDEALRVK